MKTTFNFPPVLVMDVGRNDYEVTLKQAPESPVQEYLRFFMTEGAKVQAPVNRSSFTSEDYGHARNLLKAYDKPLLVWATIEFWLKYSEPVFDRPDTNLLRLFHSRLPQIIAEG